MGTPVPPIGQYDEHLRPLGVLTTNFQVLELGVCLLAWALVGGDQKLGQMATAQMSFSKICDFTGALARYRIPDPLLLSRVIDFLGECTDVENERNKLVHSVWAHGDDGGLPVRLKITARRKDGLKQSAEPLNLDHLRHLGERMKELHLAAIDIAARLRAAGIIGQTPGWFADEIED